MVLHFTLNNSKFSTLAIINSEDVKEDLQSARVANRDEICLKLWFYWSEFKRVVKLKYLL